MHAQYQEYIEVGRVLNRTYTSVGKLMWLSVVHVSKTVPLVVLFLTFASFSKYFSQHNSNTIAEAVYWYIGCDSCILQQ